MVQDTPNTCGAQTRAGTPCAHPPMRGKKRCHLHGGKSTGPKEPHRPYGEQRHLKHGLYADHFDPVEPGIAVFSAVLVSSFVTRRIVSPIQEMTGASQRIADGRYDERVQIAGEDELAGLAR